MLSIIQRIAEDVKRGENIDLVVTIVLGFIIAVLNSLGVASQDVVASITLATLGLIAIGILITRYRIEDFYHLAGEKSIVQLQLRRPSSISETIANAEEIWMVGLLLRGTTSDYFYDFKKNLAQGAVIRALIVDLDKVQIEKIVKRFSRAGTPEHFRSDFKHIINQYRELHQAASQPDNVQLRLLDFVPSFSLYVSPRADGGGAAYVEIYCYKSPAGSVPKFLVTARENPEWYKHFIDQFELMWNDAEPVVF